MLPSPSVTKYRRSRLASLPTVRHSILDGLTRRSRLTNLAVFLLGMVCLISVLINLMVLSRPWLPSHFNSIAFSTANWPATRQNLNHLIVVPCHSIWQGIDSWANEEDWLLEPYQQGPERVRAFYQHIERSVEIADKDLHSLLVFSGGQTKPLSTTTEAESYLRLAQASGLIPVETVKSFVHARATTENYALDSYQNLLFSVARFREFTGHYPIKITVVGYEFKRARFMELHREAMRWPADKFTYVGVDPAHKSSTDAIQGEWQNGYTPYTLDSYGCHSVLLSKRRQRNPFSRFHPYYTSCPEMNALFEWCPSDPEGGKDALFDGPLPWVSPRIARDS